MLATSVKQIDSDFLKRYRDKQWSLGHARALAKELAKIYKNLATAVEAGLMTAEQADFVKTEILPKMPVTRKRLTQEQKVAKKRAELAEAEAKLKELQAKAKEAETSQEA